MSKGIATEFKRLFGGVDELKAQQKQIGHVGYLDRPPRQGIFYLITKNYYWGKPTMESLETSLLELRDLFVSRVKKSI